MKKLIALISMGFLLAFTGCTKMGVKNRALVMSAEAFDNEAQSAAKTTFADQEQQKIFADFIKLNTQIDVSDVELQGDNDATAKLTVVTFSKSVYPELVAISGKDWKAKIAEKMETKHYNLKLKKTGGTWGIVEKTEIQ